MVLGGGGIGMSLFRRKESGYEGRFGSSAGCSPFSSATPPPPPQAASAGLNPLRSSDHGQVSLGYEASSRLPVLFPSGVEWGLPLRPSGKDVVLFLEKNDWGRLSIPSQSLHAAGAAVTAPMPQIFAKLWFPQSQP